MSPVALKAEGICGGYGKMVIVHDVSMHVGEGELVALVGPNGSGKSTFLKTIYGLARRFSGRVFFFGKDVSDLRPYDKARIGLGYVPQVNNVFPELTVLENLEMGAYFRKDEEAIREDLEMIFSLFPVLKERRDQKAETLSGGERQMLAIGRALIGRPKVLLLDEPAAALAPKLAKELFKKLDEIRESGVAILLVEQHARRALEACDRGYVLVDGRVVMEGPGKELLESEDLKRAFLGWR
ncbi:ABC transporter ATP-binding protein [Candidatus Bathyarchaeota archaeon]|nr:MAG: ABC transporter ATP-binding protein [Candidatus Bathyarchaeota archaeon]